MEDTVTIVHPVQESTQLVQKKTPLDSAADAFVTRDAWGRLPITLVPTRASSHQRGHLLLAVIVVGVVVAAASVLYVLGVLAASWIMVLALSLVILLTVPLFRLAFVVHIPEGASGLLMRGGKYLRTINSGTHLVPPWIDISHLVTRREIPFSISIDEVPTQDNVRASVDTLFTFTIVDPWRFVFVLPPDDYERVLRASCQEALRVLIRRVTAADVTSLTWSASDDLIKTISADVAPYGVHVAKLKVTYAWPSAAFIRLQELHHLAILQYQTTQAAKMAEQGIEQAERQPSSQMSSQMSSPDQAWTRAADTIAMEWREQEPGPRFSGIDQLKWEHEALRIEMQSNLPQARARGNASLRDT